MWSAGLLIITTMTQISLQKKFSATSIKVSAHNKGAYAHYADDVLLYTTIYSQDDCHNLYTIGPDHEPT